MADRSAHRAGIDRDGSIVVDDPDGPRRLHGIWARDWCPCADCRFVQTAEHRWFLGRVAAPPVPVAAVLDGPDVLVDRDACHPWYDATVASCEDWDQNCIEPAYPTRALGHVEPLARDLFARDPGDHV